MFFASAVPRRLDPLDERRDANGQRAQGIFLLEADRQQQQNDENEEAPISRSGGWPRSASVTVRNSRTKEAAAM